LILAKESGKELSFFVEAGMTHAGHEAAGKSTPRHSIAAREKQPGTSS
jgi:hypothetical protein